jgi:hypothetical protein
MKSAAFDAHNQLKTWIGRQLTWSSGLQTLMQVNNDPKSAGELTMGVPTRQLFAAKLPGWVKAEINAPVQTHLLSASKLANPSVTECQLDVLTSMPFFATPPA